MKVSKVALAATALLGTTMLAAPALAQAGRSGAMPGQRQNQAQQAQQGQQAQGQAGQQQRQYNLSQAERRALQPLLQAQQAQNWTAVQAALPAAQAAAQGADARYLVARVQLALAVGTNNEAGIDQALEAVVASGSASADELPRYLNLQAERAFARNDFAAAERHYLRLSQLMPNDARIASNLSIVRQRMGNTGSALDTLMQTIRTQETANQAVDEATYRRALGLAYNARNLDQSLSLGRSLVQRYPSATNWRDVLTIYRQLANVDAVTNLDALRLARAVGGLRGESDYYTLATALNQAGLPGETKAVLDEGIASGSLQATSPNIRLLMQTAERRIGEDRSGLPGQITAARSAANGRPARIVADVLYGYGRYAEAAEMYRLALTKGGEDAALVNLRLGAALAMAGQRAEAEAALRAVTGPRATLANLWLAHLARPAR